MRVELNINIIEIVNFFKDFLLPAATIITSIVALYISQRTKKLSEGTIELSVSQQITEATKLLIDCNLKLIDVDFTKYSDDKSDPRDKDRIDKIKIIEMAKAQAKENYLNVFNQACTLFLDKKIDRVRFEKSYSESIKNIYEKESDNTFKTKLLTSYDAIRKVYEYFFNKEV